MVRLMLVLAPVMCVLGGIAISASLSSYMKYLDGSGGGGGGGGSGGGVANSAGGGQKGHKGGKGFKGKDSQVGVGSGFFKKQKNRIKPNFQKKIKHTKPKTRIF